MASLMDIRDRFVLGIDAGGTYTDIVALEGESGTVTAWSKKLTTYGNLVRGISEGLAEILETVPGEEISSVNLATTLATNAIVEERSRPCGLLLIGYDRSFLETNSFLERLGTDRIAFIPGGHDLYGDEREVLDEEKVQEAVKFMEPHVEALAVSGFFSVRNPEHELQVQEIARRLTGLPVTCGHELAAELDAVKRATTAVLNAGLIPILVDLLDAVEEEMGRIDLQVPLMVVRGDGSLVSADWARSHPVETILSGPAASAVGAAFLADKEKINHRKETAEDLWVVDMGGTTTDIVRLDAEKAPRLSSRGAMVGEYRTLIEAIDIHTLGLGGDSRVGFSDEGDILLGPKRVIPLCVAAADDSSLISVLESELLKERVEKNVLLLMPASRWNKSTDPFENRILGFLERGPLSLRRALETERVRRQGVKRLQAMEQRGLFRWCGFTPTDALHVLGRMDVWEVEASRLGAAVLAGQGNEDVFSRKVCREVSRSVSRELAGKSLQDHGLSVENISEGLFDLAFADGSPSVPRFFFRLEGAVVGIGAPSTAFLPEVESWIGRRVYVPGEAHVAVALGAAASSVRYRYGVKLTPMPSGGIRVHSPMGVREFEELEPAVQWAESETCPWVLEQARLAGAQDCRVTCRREDMEAFISGGKSKVYLGTCLWFQAERPGEFSEEKV